MAFDYRSLVADPSQAVAAGLGTYGKLQQLQMEQQMIKTGECFILYGILIVIISHIVVSPMIGYGEHFQG